MTESLNPCRRINGKLNQLFVYQPIESITAYASNRYSLKFDEQIDREKAFRRSFDQNSINLSSLQELQSINHPTQKRLIEQIE